MGFRVRASRKARRSVRGAELFVFQEWARQEEDKRLCLFALNFTYLAACFQRGSWVVYKHTHKVQNKPVSKAEGPLLPR